MRTQQPNLPNSLNNDFINRVRDCLSRVYTDIFTIFDKTAVDDPTTMGNTNSEIGGLTFSDPPTQAECEALRDKCEELADDVRNIHTTLTALIDSLQAREIV